MSNILNLCEKLTKSVLTVAVLWLRPFSASWIPRFALPRHLWNPSLALFPVRQNIFVTFSRRLSILALLTTVQSQFLG